MILFREDVEKREFEFLSEFATKSAQSRGRQYPEESCIRRTEFQRDRDRIIHSKAFRRLMHKTQVFISQERDHYRTRLTHTVEVAQISRTVANILGMNSDLAEAIALGHDLGHTPFGHSGEKILNEIYPGGFRHNEQSVRVVEVLEGDKGKDGRGLNLTLEVIDGIRNHRGSGEPSTPEGKIVQICDRIAYVNHDIDDAIISGLLRLEDLPREAIDVLGDAHGKRINTLVEDLVAHSEGANIKQGEECGEYMNMLRKFMFQNIYNSDGVKASEIPEVDDIIKTIYFYYIDNLEDISELYESNRDLIELYGKETVVKDIVAGMTDRYAERCYADICRL